MCLYPTLIQNRRYQPNQKNGRNPPPVLDTRTIYVPIGCGNCIECRKQKAREWQARLLEDIKTNTNGHFVTLTFNNESILHLLQQSITKTDRKTGEIITTTIVNLQGYDVDNAIATKAVRLFNERWRKKHKKAIRHWLVTELGHNGTENIHLHGIIWTDHIHDLKTIWQYGFVWDGYSKNGKRINYVNNQTINYCIKYIHKMDAKHKEYKSKVLTSPGIGANFINTLQAKQIKQQQIETYRTTTGHKLNLPIYWRNKIFTDEIKEQLWLQRLDKEERWICGELVNVKNGYQEYEKLIQWYRQKNQELGYGNYKNRNRKEYEENIRNIMLQTRIQNAFGGKLSKRETD